MPIVKTDCTVSMPFTKFLWLEAELIRLQEENKILKLQIRALEAKQ